MGSSVQMAVAILSTTALLCTCLPSGVTAEDYDIKDGRHTITMGTRRYHSNNYTFGDMLLFHDNPTLEGTWLPYPKVQSHDVCYPSKGSNPSRFTITAFNVTDQLPEDDGGYAFVKSGGVGEGSLCLHLKTQRGKGYKFSIDIWGHNI